MDGRTLVGVARVLNLSEFGACVESTSRLSEKTHAIVRLLLGKRHLVTLPVEVIWVRPRPHVKEYGLRFGDVPQMVKNLIQKFVKEYFEESTR